jgi:hypothetical protein
MTREIVAVDVDDTIEDEQGTLRAFMLAHHGLVLPKRLGRKYPSRHEHMVALCESVDEGEGHAKYVDYVAQKRDGNVRQALLPGAKEVLTALHARRNLIAVTRRDAAMEAFTRLCIQENLGDVFEEIHLVAGSKAEVCLERGAGDLIDDDPAEGLDMIAMGGVGLQFGDLPWSLPEADARGLVVVKDWQAVKAYYEARDAA